MCQGIHALNGVLLVLLWSGSQALFADSVLPDCGYYKLSSEEFTSRVHDFTDAVQRLVETRPDLQKRLTGGERLTDEVYEAGILQQVSGCIHDEAGGNVEVKGTDALGKLSTQGSSFKGFTVIIRGLPAGLCLSIKSQSTPQRRLFVRPEAPNEIPGKIGTCITNPATRFLTLGRKMPMPNTLYVLQPVEVSAPAEGPRPPEYCRVDLSDQLSNESIRIETGVCARVANGIGSSKDYAECSALEKRIRTYLKKLDRVDNVEIASWDAKARLNTIRPLFATAIVPIDTKLVGDRNDFVRKMFSVNKSNNIDAAYWSSELKAYEYIAEAIREKACSSFWDGTLREPSTWKSLSIRKKHDILNDVYSAFSTIKPLKINKFVVDTVGVLSNEERNLNGYYISPSVENEKKYGKDLLNSVVITKEGYHLDKYFLKIKMRQALEVTLEELMHAHQYELTDAYILGTLPRSSNACIQAPLYLYNSPTYYSPENIVQVVSDLWTGYYPSQPVELQAKRFAQHLTGMLLYQPFVCGD